MISTVLTILALCIVPAAILTAYQRVTISRFVRRGNRVLLAVHVCEDRTRVCSEGFAAEFEFQNVAIVTKRRGRTKVLRFEGPRSLDKAVHGKSQIIDLARPDADLPNEDLLELWGMFLLYCCQNVLNRVGKARSFAEVQIRNEVANERVARAVVQSAKGRWPRLIGEATASSVFPSG